MSGMSHLFGELRNVRNFTPFWLTQECQECYTFSANSGMSGISHFREPEYWNLRRQVREVFFSQVFRLNILPGMVTFKNPGFPTKIKELSDSDQIKLKGWLGLRTSYFCCYISYDWYFDWINDLSSTKRFVITSTLFLHEKVG